MALSPAMAAQELASSISVILAIAAAVACVYGCLYFARQSGRNKAWAIFWGLMSGMLGLIVYIILWVHDTSGRLSPQAGHYPPGYDSYAMPSNLGQPYPGQPSTPYHYRLIRHRPRRAPVALRIRPGAPAASARGAARARARALPSATTAMSGFRA